MRSMVEGDRPERHGLRLSLSTTTLRVAVPLSFRERN